MKQVNAYILTLTLAAGWLLLPVVVRQGPRPLLFAAAAAVLLTIEFGALIGRVDINDPPARDQQYITIRTSDQWNVSHSFHDDNVVAHVKTLSFIRDEERPTVNDSRNWPVLISAINAQYQENLFVDLLNQKRFAGWYNNIQAMEEFIEMFYGPELAAMDNKPLYGLFDGSGAPPVADSVVLISGAHIDCAGTASCCDAGSARERRELAGKYLTPGLIDAHVHPAPPPCLGTGRRSDVHP